MSKVLPILFNVDMVQAILNGRKTVTRRLPLKKIEDKWYDYEERIRAVAIPGSISLTEKEFYEQYQPYKPGDILYVREAWRVGAWDIGNQMIAFDYKDGTYGKLVHIHDRELFERLVNQSRDDARKSKCKYNSIDFIQRKGDSPCRWRPSIHMPKEATRILLRVKDVRMERLQSITEEQARAEGVCRLFDNMSKEEYEKFARISGSMKKQEECSFRNYLWHGDFGEYGTGNKLSDAWEYQYSGYDNAIGSFSSLWNLTIDLKDWDTHGWDANPWVWVVEFERYNKLEMLDV